MTNEKLRDYAAWAVILLIMLLSFLSFSEYFYPHLNADMAINVLMTPGFSIPGDLYFWGQDRAGSLIPFLSWLLCVLYKFPPVLAVSLVHFGLLTAGFFALSGFFKTRTSRLFLAAVWFFPPIHFIDHVLLLFGVQLSLLVIGVWALRKSVEPGSLLRLLLFQSGAWAMFILSVWVSDLSVVTLIVLAAFTFLVNRLQGVPPAWPKETRDRRLQLFNLIGWGVVGGLFIYYAKKHGVPVDAYNHHLLNTPGEVFGALKIVLRSVRDILTFASGNIPETIFAWMVLLIVPVVLLSSGRKADNRSFFIRNKWMLFFLVNGLVLLVTVLLSHWVYINGTGRRYFAPVFFFLFTALLIYLESTRDRQKVLRRVLLAILVIAGAISSLLASWYPERLPSQFSKLEKFKSLGKAGFIGEYWNAYLVPVADPSMLKATPHDRDHVRNYDLPGQVFGQTRLYLIRDCWLDSFPDTITQFGNLLKRKGNEFRLAGCTLCRYERSLYTRIFQPGDLQHQGEVRPDSTALSGYSLTTGKETDPKKHFVWGPFLSLKQGKILVRFHLKADQNLSVDPVAYLDVSAGYGKQVLIQKTLRFCDFAAPDRFEYIDLMVPLEQDFKGVEFRVLATGRGILSFDRIEMQGL